MWVAITRAGRQHLQQRRRTGSVALAALVGKLADEDAAALNASLPALRNLIDLIAEN